MLPGIFQTASYIRRMIAYWYDFLGAPDDADATVARKTERTAAALNPAKHINVQACMPQLGPHDAPIATAGGPRCAARARPSSSMGPALWSAPR